MSPAFMHLSLAFANCIGMLSILQLRVESGQADALTPEVKTLHRDRVRWTARCTQPATDADGLVFQHNAAECLQLFRRNVVHLGGRHAKQCRQPTRGLHLCCTIHRGPSSRMRFSGQTSTHPVHATQIVVSNTVLTLQRRQRAACSRAAFGEKYVFDHLKRMARSRAGATGGCTRRSLVPVLAHGVGSLFPR